jgi:hypothetical protein
MIGIRRSRRPGAEYYGKVDWRGFTCVPPISDGFLADPFLFEHDGRHYIFCEQFSRIAGKAAISCLEVQSDLTISSPKLVLQRPYHLSYPMLFRDQDDILMIPETGRNNQVELYRCARFPDKWDFDCALLTQTPYVDTTILRHQEKWWMFTCLKNAATAVSDQLHIYWAEKIRGPWRPHSLNPVIVSVASARPAGCFIHAHDGLIRPSQDCSRRYGAAIKFNQVRKLSETEYEEEPIGSLDGQWHPRTDGAHTWNQNEEYEVIDGPIFEPKLRVFG